jgi:ornithine cyclodeaminase/alanine dehydrogenase-like protein (mu-crystallin family)
VLTVKTCLKRCSDTFKWVGSGQVEQSSPFSFWVSPPEDAFGSGFIQAYPAYLKPLRVAGIKWLGGYSQNRRRGLPMLSAVDIINDVETSLPLAILDGAEITGMRTGGHSTVGAKYLAREDSSVLAIIGCGVQAHYHVMHMAEAFDLREVRVFDAVPDTAQGFRSAAQEHVDIPITVSSSAREATDEADIVCMCTSARQSVVQEEWIGPGCCVCGINGFLDLDPDCAVKFEKWVLGYYDRDLEWVDGSEVGKNSPEKAPYTRDHVYADLATEISQGKKQGRETAEERIVFTHHGMPALDVAVAALVYEEALKAGIGQELQLY